MVLSCAAAFSPKAANPVNRALIWLYRPVIGWCARPARWTVLIE